MSRNSNSYIQPSTSSHAVHLDPSAPGTVIRYAMAIEAGFNILGAAGLILAPRDTLSYLVPYSSQITPVAASLTQWLGAVVLALTTPLLLCLPDSRRAVESRTTVYWTLAAGEGFLVPLFLVQLMQGDRGGFTRKALVLSSIQLSAMVGWRLYVLLRRPDWMGRYRDVKKDD